MDLMEKIVALCKRRGFIYPSSEIYGGLQGFWDYGPLGVELKRNVKKEWWASMVYLRDDVVGLDASIIMNPEVWKASGHLEAFTDPLVECRNCHKRFRVDHLALDKRELGLELKKANLLLADLINIVEKKHESVKKVFALIDSLSEVQKSRKDITVEESDSFRKTKGSLLSQAEKVVNKAGEDIEIGNKLISEMRNTAKYVGTIVRTYLDDFVACPNCGVRKWDTPKTFNLLTEVYLGVTEPKDRAYLRGEITQGVFVNFGNVVSSSRVKVPFGVAQIGKAFRNEITPGNFTFRSREFEQMELEYFVKPEEKESQKTFEYWKKERMEWYIKLGIKKENLRFREHAKDEIAHYARYAEDIEYNSPFGWKEFEGIHHRGDWDLGRHKLTYKDVESGKEYTPWVIETSGGVDRATLFFLLDAYHEEKDRVILKLHPKLAPFKVAVFPLLANKEELVKKARKIYEEIKPHYSATWDDRGNIGKRYFAQDEIGTPFCITVDFQSLEDGMVTVRDRDTAKQERIRISEIKDFLDKKMNG